MDITLHSYNDSEYRPEEGRNPMELVCKSTLHKYFEFPEDAESIQLCITKTPTEDNYLVNGSVGNRIEIGENQEMILLIGWAKRILEGHGFPCYVSLKY